MNGEMRGALLSGALMLAALGGCAPTVPGLEASLQPTGSGVQGGGAVGSGVSVPAGQVTDPDWNSRERIPNTNPRILTNNAYGPGRSSDAYGRVVYHTPGLRIEESALGTGDYQDQYGRSVRCYGSGMGTFCR